jgi:hypothetical protein
MTEAENLRLLFKGINRKEFAKLHKLKGGDAMIYQHITGRRPISLQAAVAYAKAFDVPLSTISSRLADLLDKPPKKPETQTAYLTAEPEPKYSKKVMQLAVPEDPDISEVVRMMRETDPRGRAMALAAVKVALNGVSGGVKNAVQ